MNEFLTKLKVFAIKIKTEIFDKVYTKSEVDTKITQTVNSIDDKVLDAIDAGVSDTVDAKINLAITDKKLIDEATLAKKSYVDKTYLADQHYIDNSALANYVTTDSLSDTVNNTVESSITSKNLATKSELPTEESTENLNAFLETIK